MGKGTTLFDVCIWHGFSEYVGQFPKQQLNRAIQTKALWNNGSIAVVADALEGKYGKLVAHEHIWTTLTHQLNKVMPADKTEFMVSLCKRVIELTGGTSNANVAYDKGAIETLMYRHVLPDFEDAKVIYGSLAAHANTVVTHDFELSMSVVPGLFIRYEDNLTAQQRRVTSMRHR